MTFEQAERDAGALAGRLLRDGGRVLLLGAPGTGKSTLARELGAACRQADLSCACLGADPGSPAFGVPGALSLGLWREGAWHPTATEALCTLDAARFRLPLVEAVRRLAARAPPGALLVDAPGVVRGAAGAELAPGLARAAGVESVLILVRPGRPLPLENELAALGLPVLRVSAAPGAARPGDRARGRARTALWDARLAGGPEQILDAERLRVVGMPPPLAAEDAWAGRQAAFLDGRGATRGLAEVLARRGMALRVRLAPDAETTGVLLVRDARRGPEGLLESAPPAREPAGWLAAAPDLAPGGPPGDGGPRPVVEVGPARAALVNGVLGDPLLHVRLRQRRRSLLFDLGDARLPARLAHQVSDVLVTHAHLDHIGGFPWLLRSRMGLAEPCRLYGPPGLAGHLQGFLDGVRWDRIGDAGPRFRVTELHGERMLRFRLQAGRRGPMPEDEAPAGDGLLLEEPGLRFRAATLDHGIPVLAYALEFPRTFHVRKERLAALGLPPGPWLSELKDALARDAADAPVALPDGSTRPAGALGRELVITAPGQTLAYATDFADTEANRRALAALARGARVLLCESTFLVADAERAAATGHLTTRACAAIAEAAGVERLVPFHFSRRYESAPERVYEELATFTPRLARPPPRS